MIRLKYYPVRFDKEGLRVFDIQEHTIQGMALDLDIPIKNVDVICNGKIVDLGYLPKNGDEIIITPKIGRKFLSTFYDPLGFGYGRAIFGVPSAFVNINPGPEKLKPTLDLPNFGTTGESSPTYGFDGISNTQEPGLPIAIVYGRHRVGGNIINQFVRTDGAKQYLNMLIAIGEGELNSISEIQINQNPVENFSDITQDQRLGTNSQTAIPNFNDLHRIYPVNANLTQGNPYVYTTINNDVEAFEIKLTFPQGIYQQSGNGSYGSWLVIYQVEYKLTSSGTYIDIGTTDVREFNQGAAVFRIFRKDNLTPGQYDIRVTRISEDSMFTPQNSQGDLQLTNVDEIITENLTYPNIALHSIEALATDQLSGSTPTVTALVEGRKINIPRVLTTSGGTDVLWEDYYWEPTAAKYKKFSDNSDLYWDGSTYIDKWSANPVWCIKDLLLNSRYGVGNYLDSSLINTTDWLEMSRYCEEKVDDGFGGFEKRFRLDVVLDASSRVPDLLSQLAGTFRAFTFYSNGTIKLHIDKPSDPVQMFGMGNIIASSFSQSWKALTDKLNSIDVQFTDETKNYSQEIVSVVDEEALNNNDPIRKGDLRILCTRLSQAVREGRFALKTSKHIDRVTTLRCGIDAIACQVGDVINITHDVPQWGFSGRVPVNGTNSTTKVNLDREITIEEGKAYKLLIRFNDDSQEEKDVTNVPGSYTYVNVTSALSQAPVGYEVYSVGEDTKVISPHRIINLKRAGNNEVEITAIEYDERIYDDDFFDYPENNYSALSLTVPTVQNLTLTERLVQRSDGTIEDAIDIWFQKPISDTAVLTFQKAKIYISDDSGGHYDFAGETTGTHFAIIGNLNDLTTYRIAVTSVSFNGVETAIANSPTEDIQILGKTLPPSDVATFLINQNRDRLYFGWVGVDDVDLAGYEIRVGETWDSGDILATQVQNSTHIELNMRLGADQSFWIKAIDTSGNYSENPTEAVITIDNIPFSNVVSTYNEEVAWTGTKVNTVKVGDVLELDTGDLTGTYVTPVRDVGYIANFKIGIEGITVVSGDETWQDFGEQTFEDVSPVQRFNGAEIAGALSYRIKTSDDNSTWSAWMPYQTGDYSCRYFQIEMTMTRLSVSQALQCLQLYYYADLPDIDEFGSDNVSVAASGKAVTFVKTFHEAPNVNISILGGAAYVWKFSTIPSTTGFTVKLYDLAGTTQTGSFSYQAHGI